ncbi:MAG TPA: hypothetical protein VEB64_12745 [Azospirillaceae bacterium]|nr:hypothetical protein [Azospirillaceae bacterium]
MRGVTAMAQPRAYQRPNHQPDITPGPVPQGKAHPGIGQPPRKMGFYDASEVAPTTQRDPWISVTRRPAGPSAGWKLAIPVILVIVLILILMTMA